MARSPASPSSTATTSSSPTPAARRPWSTSSTSRPCELAERPRRLGRGRVSRLAIVDRQRPVSTPSTSPRRAARRVGNGRRRHPTTTTGERTATGSVHPTTTTHVRRGPGRAPSGRSTAVVEAFYRRARSATTSDPARPVRQRHPRPAGARHRWSMNAWNWLVTLPTGWATGSGTTSVRRRRPAPPTGSALPARPDLRTARAWRGRGLAEAVSRTCRRRDRRARVEGGLLQPLGQPGGVPRGGAVDARDAGWSCLDRHPRRPATGPSIHSANVRRPTACSGVRWSPLGGTRSAGRGRARSTTRRRRPGRAR